MTCPACQAENDGKSEVCPSCGQLLAGQALGRGSVVASRYEILDSLGRGGMGVVFKARDRALDETLALKILRADVARAPELERRFRSEIKLARRVRHRNVCGIHEYGEDGPLRYIAMELIEGTDLKAWLREKGALATDEAYDVAIQLTQGLEAIHEAGVVHRDLKSSNVMLDSRGRVRLMDFGIAKQLGGEATLGGTAIGHIVGTPEYMSPEQARGDQIDSRSDLYALGIVIYEIFTGHVPFRGDTPIATLFKTLEQPPVLEGPAAAGIPTPMVPVLSKALAKQPTERYASARELMDAIKAAQRTSGQDAGGRTPIEAATVQLSSLGTDVSLPAVTESATPLRSPPQEPPLSPDASVAPTEIRDPPRVARGRTSDAVRLPGPGRRRPAEARSVWPWFLAAGIALALVAGGIAFALYRLLTSAMPGPTRDAVQARASPKAVSAPPTPGSALPAEPGPGPTESPTQAEVASPTAPPRLVPSHDPLGPAVAPRAPTRQSPSAHAQGRPAPPPSPFASAASPAAADAPGLLQLRVTPWAAVSVDETYVGTTPLQPLSLSPGSHSVRLTHPDYKPLQRKLTIRTGETTRLEIDLSWDAVPRPNDR